MCRPRSRPPGRRLAKSAPCGARGPSVRPAGSPGASAALSAVLTVLLLLSTRLAPAQVSLVSIEPLQIEVAGQRVVDDWYLDPPAEQVETRQVPADGWAQVYHRWAVGEGWKMRQEVAARPDRLEITHMRLLETGTVGVASTGVTIPLETFDGAFFECIGTITGGAQREGRTWRGALGPDDVTVIKNLEYLRVHLPGGALDFDGNHKGSWCPGEGICPGVERFTLIRYDDGWRLWAADGKARRGALHTMKLVVLPAREAPVADVHPVVNTRWTEPYIPTSRVNIGTFAVDRFAASVQPGGELTRDERFVDVQPERVEGAAITGGELTLTIPVERDGVYLVSLLAGDPEREIGPCTLSAGVDEPRQTAAVAAGDYACWVTPGRAVEGEIAVSVTGNARICALQAAPMMFANEDYLLDRGWWVSTDFHEDDALPR